MKRTLFIIITLFLGLYLSGCTRIESENVGVKTTFSGKVETTEKPQGFYTTVFSDIDEFSAKEITIELDDMTPKAGDNLTMDDLDIEVYYKVRQDQIAEQHLKYANRTAKDHGVYYAGYYLVRSVAREAAYDAVAKYDSLQVHKNRDAIGEAIMQETQASVDGSDPGIYTITRVIIRNADTDATVEESIRIAVAKDKELEAVTKQVRILEQQALANNELTSSLTPEILTDRYLDILSAAAESGNLKLVDLGCQGGTLLNIPLRD